MPHDVFLSYATPDRDRAAELASALEAAGHSVWWDRTIPPGRNFDEVIEAALADARAVVVLWTHHSVASSWVKAEAEEAAARGVLIPALLEDVEIPLRFRQIQAADLRSWQGDPHASELRALVASLAGAMGPSGEVAPASSGVELAPEPVPGGATASRPSRQESPGRPVMGAVVIVIAALVLAAAAVFLLNRPQEGPLPRARELAPEPVSEREWVMRDFERRIAENEAAREALLREREDRRARSEFDPHARAELDELDQRLEELGMEHERLNQGLAEAHAARGP